MTQAGLCHTVIGSPPESCCTRSPSPGRATALLVLALVLLALQNSLIYHGKRLWENQLSQNRSRGSYATHACGGRGGTARGVRCSMRVPEVDRIGIRGWREAEVTCWSNGWESGGTGGGRDKKHKQLFFFSLSFSLFLSLSGRLKAHWQCSAVKHVLGYTVILMNYWTVVSGCDTGQHTCMLQSDRRVKGRDYLHLLRESCRWEERICTQETISWNHKHSHIKNRASGLYWWPNRIPIYRLMP